MSGLGKEKQRSTRVYPIMSQKYSRVELEGSEMFMMISFEVMDDTMISTFLKRKTGAIFFSVLLFRGVDLTNV